MQKRQSISRFLQTKSASIEMPLGSFDHFPGSPNHSVLSPASSFSVDAGSNLMSRMSRIVTSFSPRSADIDEERTRSAELTNSSSSFAAASPSFVAVHSIFATAARAPLKKLRRGLDGGDVVVVMVFSCCRKL